jgi:hypothetical protein
MLRAEVRCGLHFPAIKVLAESASVGVSRTERRVRTNAGEFTLGQFCEALKLT